MLGPTHRDDKEVVVLNRAVKWGKTGIELEADQRHADIIIKQTNLTGANGVKTQCEEERKWEVEALESWGNPPIILTARQLCQAAQQCRNS